MGSTKGNWVLHKGLDTTFNLPIQKVAGCVHIASPSLLRLSGNFVFFIGKGWGLVRIAVGFSKNLFFSLSVLQNCELRFG